MIENGQWVSSSCNDVPMVVTTVVEKKSAWPNVQFGSLVAFRNADIPRALAFKTSEIKSSNSSSAMED